MPHGEDAKRLVLLCTEGKMAIYLDTSTGKEVSGPRKLGPEHS